MLPPLRRPAFILFAVCGLVSACSPAPGYERPQAVCRLPSVINEASGLAASHLDPNLLWLLNDSGGQAVLYALAPNGTRRGAVRIAGVDNRDWEDLASFELDGRAWLLIADTGDNQEGRGDCALYVIPEPDTDTLRPLEEIIVSIAWKIPVRFPDGPRDCEAVAVDPVGGLVYLLEKRHSPPRLYTVPLRPAADGRTPALLPVASLTTLPGPTLSQRLFGISAARYRGQPTALSFAADGSAALVLTYGDLLIFPRAPGESWTQALSGEPRQLPPPKLMQAEAATFACDSLTVFVAGEGNRTGLLRYRPSAP